MRLPHAALLASLALVVPSPSPAASPGPGSAGGILWTVPSRWTQGRGSTMRVATYEVPGAKDASAGECAVFFFGPGQGGGVDDNVARWARQFDGAPTPKRTTATVGGIRLTRVEVTGTYLAPGGAMMQSTGKRPGYQLLGAIVEAPGGNVFFKLTGPVSTLAAARGELDALVASIRPEK